MRKVAVRDITRATLEANNGQPKLLGHLIDDGSGEPFGTTPQLDDMLGQRDRRERFEYYFAGYSNGYVEWIDASKVG